MNVNSYSYSTTTTTTTSPNSTVKETPKVSSTTLHLKPNIIPMINGLIKMLNDVKAFSDEEKEQVQEFALNVPREETKQNENSEEITNWLCLLYNEAINPALIRAFNNTDENTLNQIAGEIITILESVLPQGKTAADAIEEYAILTSMVSDEEELGERELDELVELIDEEFQELMNVLAESANNANQELSSYFNNIQSKVFKLQANKEIKSNQAHKRLDTLSKKIEKVSADYKSNASKTLKISDRLKNEQKDYQGIVDKAAKIFKKVE